MTTIYELKNADARLVSYDFFHLKPLIDRATEAVLPLLTPKPTFKLYGRTCQMQRNIGFFSPEATVTGYKYSGQKETRQQMPPALMDLLKDVNGTLNTEYNAILVNEYQSGTDYISAHRDDESGVDTLFGVLTISSGAPRLFRLREVVEGTSNRPIVFNVVTHDSYALLMHGSDFQKRLTHEIVPSKKIHGSRISFTFRRHFPN